MQPFIHKRSKQELAMKIYSVLVNKGGAGVQNKSDLPPIFIEEKFSIMAFLFQSLWLLYNRIWMSAIILIILEYSLFSLFENGLITEFTFYGVKMSIAVFVAISAKSWYIESLKRKNYQVVDVLVVKDLDEAKLRFYQKT